MECLKCKGTLAEGELICPNCNDNAAQTRQKAKCDDCKKKTTSLLNDSFHSVSYLISLICLSVVTVIFAISIVSAIINGNYLYMMVPMIICLCSAIPMSEGWKAYKNSDDISSDSIRKMSMFAKTMKVFGILLCIVTSILCSLLLILVIVLASTLDDIGQLFSEIGNMMPTGDEGAAVGSLGALISGGSQFAVFIIIAAMLLVCFFFFNFTKTYSNAIKYYDVLGKIASLSEYDITNKAPIKRMYVFGGLGAILGIASFAVSWESGLMLLGIGGYTITTGIWFNSIHQGQINNHNQFLHEQKLLEEITENTAAERRRIEQENKARANEQQQAVLIDQQEQQKIMQQMMQMMMMQGMKDPARTEEPTDKK